MAREEINLFVQVRYIDTGVCSLCNKIIRKQLIQFNFAPLDAVKQSTADLPSVNTTSCYEVFIHILSIFKVSCLVTLKVDVICISAAANSIVALAILLLDILTNCRCHKIVT